MKDNIRFNIKETKKEDSKDKKEGKMDYQLLQKNRTRETIELKRKDRRNKPQLKNKQKQVLLNKVREFNPRDNDKILKVKVEN